MPEEKIIFYVKNKRRFGVLNRCNKNEYCVIFSHGFLGNKERFKEATRIFCSHDISSFRFDFVGHGESDGTTLDITISQEVEDLKKVIDIVKTEGYEKIGLFGNSLGGTISILSCSEEIDCLAVLNPVIFGKEVFLKFLNREKLRELERKGYASFRTSNKKTIKLSEKFFEEVIKTKIIDKIKKINCPILFLVSEKDTVVSPNQSKSAFKEANEPKKLEIIAGADHDLLSQRKYEVYVYETAARWFKKWLR
jgi:hypothetical protein